MREGYGLGIEGSGYAEGVGFAIDLNPVSI